VAAAQAVDQGLDIIGHQSSQPSTLHKRESANQFDVPFPASPTGTNFCARLP
jgi:hypothetical protein